MSEARIVKLEWSNKRNCLYAKAHVGKAKLEIKVVQNEVWESPRDWHRCTTWYYTRKDRQHGEWHVYSFSDVIREVVSLDDLLGFLMGARVNELRNMLKKGQLTWDEFTREFETLEDDAEDSYYSDELHEIPGIMECMAEFCFAMTVREWSQSLSAEDLDINPGMYDRHDGWIVMTNQEMMECFAADTVTDEIRDKAKEMMVGQVKEFSAYMQGEVYGYIVTLSVKEPCAVCGAENTAQLLDESGWGYIGDIESSGLLESINDVVAELGDIKVVY